MAGQVGRCRGDERGKKTGTKVHGWLQYARRGVKLNARAPKKTKTKKKSSTRIKDEDDSDIASGSGGEKKSPSRKGGFHVSYSP